MKSTFGSIMRELRKKKGIGIKKLAPDLNLDYTYLSRIENDKVYPSEHVIEKIANYFEYDKDELMLKADRIPKDIKEILRDNPQEALSYLRERFSNRATSRRK